MSERLVPIGLIPKYLHDEKRLWAIMGAITRYQEANLTVPSEWIEEYKELFKVVVEDRERRKQNNSKPKE